MRLRSALIAAVVSAAVIGCGLNQEGIAPPPDRIFYPGAILVEPDLGPWLFVLNSNADLRFNDGTVVAVNLDKARDAYRAARTPTMTGDPVFPLCADMKFFNPLSGDTDTCCWDALDHEILNCDERQFVEKSATVRVGSFGSALARMKAIPDSPAMNGMVGRPSRGPILLAGVRGNDSITWIAETAAKDSMGKDSITLGCAPGSGPDAFVECDEAHRVTATTDPPGPTDISPTVLLPEEPYALAVDDEQELLYVGHLRNGYLSSVNLATSTPKLIGPFPGIFPADINGSAGVTSLTLTAHGINSGRVYAASRFVPRAGAFAPISFGATADPSQLTPIQLEAARADDNTNSFLANAGDVFVSPLPGSEIRGIQVIPDAHRTFLLQRTPPVLIGFDTSNPGNNVPADILEMCSGPTFLDVNPPYFPGDTGGNKLLYVTCFEAGEVYVVDPYVPRLVAIIEVGRGPSGLAFSPANADVGARAYVVGFGSNNVSVIDIEPASPTQNHVLMRIGFPNPVPR